MAESKELSPEELRKAKEFFQKNPWIGKTHIGKMAKGVLDDEKQRSPGKTHGATGQRG
jgi:hypothetical protein